MAEIDNHIEDKMNSRLRQLVKPYIPEALRNAVRQTNDNSARQEQQRRDRFNVLRGRVVDAIAAIHELTPQQCGDVEFLEKQFIPKLGLNDENLTEQPQELSPHFGKGLHIWQYPSQLAKYLVWLRDGAAETRCYVEIGCRWGGMFILIVEWLRKNGADLESVVAIDPIEQTPFIESYFEYLSAQAVGPEATYIQDFSSSSAVRELVGCIKPDMVFIDGDHSLHGALRDHLLVREYANTIVHHDIFSQACPDTTFLWTALKSLERQEFEMHEFTDQYDSVDGNFLGIGAMKRK